MENLFLVTAKRIDNGEWVDGYFRLWIDRINKHHYTVYVNPKIGSFEVIPKTVGLFTGQIDKNQTKIFHGSIIKYYAKILLVQWVNSCAGFRLKPLNSPFKDNFEYDSLFILFEKDDIEVIGNQIDNTELL